jgi:hypothetical protein
MTSPSCRNAVGSMEAGRGQAADRGGGVGGVAHAIPLGEKLPANRTGGSSHGRGKSRRISAVAIISPSCLAERLEDNGTSG